MRLLEQYNELASYKRQFDPEGSPPELPEFLNEPFYYIIDLRNLMSRPNFKTLFPEFARTALTEEFRQDLEIFWRACCKVLNRNFAFITHLDLGENDLENLKPFRELSQLKRLTCLSLRNNKILFIQELRYFSGLVINELDMSGNPFINTGGYVREDVIYMLSLFPFLEIVDQNFIPDDVKEEIVIHSSSNVSLLPDINIQSTFESQEERAWIEWFLNNYFTTFDTNRAEVMSCYQHNAIFSFSYDINAYADLPETFESKLSLRYLKPFSRNLLYILRDSTARETLLNESLTLRIGKEAIYELLIAMPNTIHNLTTNLIDVSSYDVIKIVDELNPYQSPITKHIMVNYHGQCQQMDEKGIKYPRSIDCQLILTPNLNPLTQQTLRYLIQNQQYQIRPYVSLSLTKIFKGHEIERPSTPYSFVDTGSRTELTALHESIIVQFTSITGLRREYALPCLEYSNWNISNAINTFNTEKMNGNIPLYCFQ
ncbi:hypothetical protein NAEGRDRAFT_67690 [Naegleria gruberi]|uniref:Uncharacterized protein AM44 n=1 Tax=Naegleria gruberi TaxID=5762 RepID=D2VFN8_NAEGR|nr:uncharacterized protein NAEGRDRAFT_67690 [Naegleria gruberi]EFC44390.1 hypothetical protein NAEGRDRAFT_67690 [Naegleria gruberi]|eukprot:XP_002677134.1 hypothetical protein NAEGRDRAFT_67690 [Naegleria gruberi strain NEG-M]